MSSEGLRRDLDSQRASGSLRVLQDIFFFRATTDKQGKGISNGFSHSLYPLPSPVELPPQRSINLTHLPSVPSTESLTHSRFR